MPDGPGRVTAGPTTRATTVVRSLDSVGVVEADLSERGLAARAADGDPEAWTEIYRRAYPRLLDYALRRLPGRAAADDAVSETMARAIARIDRFTWQGNGLDAWLYGILRNVVLEQHRDGARSHPLPTESRASSDPGPLEQLLDGEEQQALRVAFERLAPGDQEVLELRLVGGLSAAGAAQVLGRREGAVRMAQWRALVRLRRLLEEVHGER